MKHLSYILALWVLLLSTVPCFLEDKCLFQCANEQTEEPCADNDGSSCTDFMYRLQLFTISTLQHMHRLSNTQIVSFTNRRINSIK